MVRFDSYLADGLGNEDIACTAPFYVPQATADYDIRIWSRGKVDGNWVRGESDTGSVRYITKYDIELARGDTYDFTFDPVPRKEEYRFNLASVGLIALQQDSGGMTGETVRLNAHGGSSYFWLSEGLSGS